MTRFDRYVVIDWSASASPKTGKDSIWIADLPTDGEPALHNPATRSEARGLLAGVLDGSGPARALIGIDASLGYPTGTARQFGLRGTPWRAMWDAVAERSTDDAPNANNRFEVAAALNTRAAGTEGPFWGCPSDGFGVSLRRTKPSGFAVGEFRRVEQRLRSARRHPKSCWQLLGAGSVGSQTLTLLPILDGLLDRVDVWPLTTGLQVPTGDRPVVAEIWPTMFVSEIPVGMIADAAQVVGTAHALRDADRSGELVAWFAPELSPHDTAIVESEEGWMLGPIPA